MHWQQHGWAMAVGSGNGSRGGSDELLPKAEQRHSATREAVQQHFAGLNGILQSRCTDMMTVFVLLLLLHQLLLQNISAATYSPVQVKEHMVSMATWSSLRP